jgi:predicted TIM-barrel fold metal-dependent hydrolase
MTNRPDSPRWIDADAHVLEPRSMWDHLDREFRDRVHITTMTDDPDYRDILYDVALDGHPIPIVLGSREQNRFERLIVRFKEKYPRGAGAVPAQYLADLDREGLAQVVLYPTLFLWAPWIPQLGARFSAALARAWNDWIYDFCAADRKRLRPVVVVSLHDVEAAIREVRRCADRSFVGVFVRPNPLYGRTLGHPDYHPFYAVLEELGLPLGIHEGQISYLPTLGLDRTEAQWAAHCMSHPFEQMAAMISLLEHGVLTKFPRLQVLFLEGGTALWVPYWLNRLDIERDHYRASGLTGKKASELFARQCFVTCEVDDPYLPQTLACMGDTRLMMSTDYPHLESPYPHSVRLFSEQKIPEESRERIGGSNVKAAYPRL